MKIIYTRLIYAIVLIIAVALYTVTLFSLDYTLVGDGFSPFKTWNPIQTAYFAIVGFVLLSILILNDIRDRKRTTPAGFRSRVKKAKYGIKKPVQAA
ncbi:MAG: hypothetical protein ACFFCX_14255, partial [Candidatus Sifarchaeia archaeon]